MLGQQILIKLIDIILQSRVDVKKSQIRKFDQIHRQIKYDSQKAYGGNLRKLLDNLIYIETYGLRKMIDYGQKIQRIAIVFYLQDNQTMKSTCAQFWIINYDQYNQLFEQSMGTQFIMTARLIQELLFFLNQQPLFSQYYKSPSFKQQFTINYQLQVVQTTAKKKQIKQATVLDKLNHQYIRQRLSESLFISIKCSCLPRSDIFWHGQQKTNTQKSGKTEQSTIDSSFLKAEKISIKTPGPLKNSPRKISLYQLYDDDLDFVFLSSSDEQFKKQNKLASIKQVSIDDCKEQSQQFQLLFASRDEEFVQSLKDYLTDFAANQTSYIVSFQ